MPSTRITPLHVASTTRRKKAVTERPRPTYFPSTSGTGPRRRVGPPRRRESCMTSLFIEELTVSARVTTLTGRATTTTRRTSRCAIRAAREGRVSRGKKVSPSRATPPASTFGACMYIRVRQRVENVNCVRISPDDSYPRISICRQGEGGKEGRFTRHLVFLPLRSIANLR